MGMWAELPPGSIPVTEILEVQKRPATTGGCASYRCRLFQREVVKGLSGCLQPLS